MADFDEYDYLEKTVEATVTRNDTKDDTRDHKRSRNGEKRDERDRDRDGDRDRERSDRRGEKEKDREHRRDREKDLERERENDRDRRSSRDRARERERRSSSRSRHEREAEREMERARSRERVTRERELEREIRDRESRRFKDKREAGEPEADPERDQRTVFAYQMPLKATERDVYDFFSKAGKVRDVRLIMDRNSRRSKGVGYIEFYDAMSVPMAIAMSGLLLLGQPVMVKPSEAEKNLVQPTATGGSSLAGAGAARKIYVGNLHFNITEEQLRQSGLWNCTCFCNNHLNWMLAVFNCRC